MIAYVLILIVYSSISPAIDHVQFPSKEACLVAWEQIKDAPPQPLNVQGYCIPEGVQS